MWPLSRKSPIDEEMIDWMFDHAEWLLVSHPRRSSFVQAQLIPISPKMFPHGGHGGHALAEILFTRICELAKVSDLSIRLVEREDSGRFAPTGNRYAPQPMAVPAGTYSIGPDGREISYSNTLLSDPVHFVAVMAHELAHAVVGLVEDVAPPSDADFNEMLTDFTAVFLGFGLFQIAWRRDMKPWSAEVAHAFANLYTYYMNRRELCFATALFADVHGVEDDLLLRAADPDVRGELKRAMRSLRDHRARVAGLRQHMSNREQE